MKMIKYELKVDCKMHLYTSTDIVQCRYANVPFSRQLLVW